MKCIQKPCIEYPWHKRNALNPPDIKDMPMYSIINELSTEFQLPKSSGKFHYVLQQMPEGFYPPVIRRK